MSEGATASTAEQPVSDTDYMQLSRVVHPGCAIVTADEVVESISSLSGQRNSESGRHRCTAITSKLS